MGVALRWRQMEASLQEHGLTGLNDRSPAYVTRKKPFVSSYDILMKRLYTKKKKKIMHMY